MIEFHTLGSLDLRHATGERIGSILAHPKRVGLLLYLALEGRGRPIERDLLASLFWPEDPMDRARGSFRTALSQIRKSLGPDAIEANAQQVSLRLDVVKCDALAVLDSAEATEWERGADLAIGPLAPGFYLGELREFDRWLDVQRERIRRAATLALRTAAEEHVHRDADRAERYLARAAILSPFDEAILTERLRLLAARGDRTGASALYQTWSAELLAELELEPSAEVEALHRSIVANEIPQTLGTESGAASRTPGQPSTPPVTPVTPVTVDPSVSGPAAPPSGAVAEHPHRASVRPGPVPQGGSRPWFGGTRTLVAVGITLAVAWTGWPLVRGVPADPASPPATRATPGVPPEPPTAAMVALVDSGMALYRRGDVAAATEVFRSATRGDPDYVRALYGLALTGYGAGRRNLFPEAVEALESLRPFMSRGESLRLDALVAAPDEAHRIYEELMAEEPDSLDVVLQYGELAFHWGSFWGIPRFDVEQAFRRLADGYAPRTANAHLVRMLAADGDLAGARARLRAMQTDGAEPLDLLVGRTLVALLDPALAPPVEEVASGTASEISLVAGAAAALLVEPDAVDDFLERMFYAVEEPNRLELAIWNALAAASRGRMARAEEWLTRAEAYSPARADEFRAVIGTLGWLQPDVARWRRVATRLGRWRHAPLVGPYWEDMGLDAIYEPREVFLAFMTELPAAGGDRSFAAFDSLVQQTALDLELIASYRDILRARSALVADNRPEDAIDVLGQPRLPPGQIYPSLLDHPFAARRFLRARALVSARRREEAYAWLNSFPDPSGYDRAYTAERLILSGDVEANLGRYDEAIRDYQRAAAFLEGSDAIFQPKQRYLERRLEELRRR